MMQPYSISVRLDETTRERLREIVEGRRYRSANAAIVDAINQIWETLQHDELEAAYAAAAAENPAYPYESQNERSVARSRRQARHHQDADDT